MHGDSGGTNGAAAAEQRWQSDIIVDLLQRYGLPYVALNPGASYRGLHDSLINYGGNNPKMLLCQHEEIAVQVAHGYARATGGPMAAILHDLVGLLHANLAIYYAYVDRAPVFIIGATGPMDEAKRRPHIDWSHTALVQGEAVRNYVKWDYQPTAIDGVPESFARAYSIMLTQPQGPVYMCYDAMLQEEPLTRPVPLPPGNAAAVPATMAADPETLAAIADRLLSAEFPLLLAEYVGRSPGGFEKLAALAECIGAPVWDIDSALNFPNRHPLNLTSDDEALGLADVILSLDVRDSERPTTKLDSTNRLTTSLVRDSCDWMEIGFGEINISKWSMDYGRLQPCTIRALGDPALAVPELTRLCRRRIDGDARLAKRIRDRAAEVSKQHDALMQRFQEKARVDWDATPITLPRLAVEVWQAIETEDWVLTAGTLRSWARKLWNFDKPYRHPGKSLGTATQRVHLRDLPVEGRLSDRTEPRREVGLQCRIADGPMHCSPKICLQDRPLKVIRDSRKSFFMLPNVLYEGRPPRPDSDRIDQQQPFVLASVQQVCAQRGRSAEIVRYYLGSIETPMPQERSQDSVLHAQGYILTCRFFGLPVAQEIEDMQGVVASELAGDRSPHIGRKRRAMNEDDRIASAEGVICDGLSAKVETLGQAPFD